MASRWDKAKSDSHGWVWRREAAIAVLSGVLAVAALAATGGSSVSLGNEIIVVGAALLGVALLPPMELAWNYLRAPKRLLQERVTELEQLVPSASDPVAFVREFSAWLRAKRAAVPAYPVDYFLSFDDGEARARRKAEEYAAGLRYREACNEVERQTRVEYHNHFRERALAISGGAETAADPHTFEDFKAVQALLEQRVEPEPTPPLG
ncbi:MAG: hypothetical protein M3Z33_05530 [Actinomycetota bacterium]|nr:hypothetical protein [Actinomycetota bacterium]